MNRHVWLLLAVLTLAMLTSAEAQTETTSRPPKLEPIFHDDFRQDTRGDYEIQGNVTWQQGKLTLSEGESITRTLDGGPWAKVALGLTFPQLTAEQSESEVRVWFINCYLRIRRQLENGKVMGSVALVQVGEKDGELIGEVIRESEVQFSNVTQLTIEHRNGLITVEERSEPLFTAYFWNGTSEVKSTIVDAAKGTFSLSDFSALTARSNTRPLTDKEREQFANAEKANRELKRLYGQAEFAEAARIGEEVRKTYREVLGESDPFYASSLNNLARLYSNMGDYARAEPLYRQTIEIRKMVLGVKHPSFASSLNNLATLYQEMGDYERAEPLYQEARDINKLAFGVRHSSYTSSLNNLAVLYHELGSYDRAEPLLTQVADIRKSMLGEQHPGYAQILNNLATLYSAMGDNAQAEKLWQQALEIYSSTIGEKHPSYAQTLSNLAALYKIKGDYTRAEPLFRQSLEIRKSVFGEKHPSYAESLDRLGVLFSSMGDYARAEQLYRQAFEIRKSVLGEEHPAFAQSLHNLGVMFDSVGDYAQAEPLYQQAMDIRKSVLGEDHPAYASSLNNLAQLYRNMGDYSRAELLQRQASEIWKTALGENDPQYAGSLNNLASLYRNMGDFVRAEKLYQQCRDTWKTVLGEEHPDYALSLNNLAELYYCQGNYEEAQQLSSRANAIVRKNLDRNSLMQSDRQQKRNQSEQRYYLDSRLAIGLESGSDVREVLETLWRWKGAVTFRQQAYRRIASNPKLAPTFESLQSVSRQLSALSGRVAIPPTDTATESARTAYAQKRKRWNDQFTSLNRQREDLERQIAADSDEFRSLREPLTVSAVQQQLPAKTAFVDFLDYAHPSLDSVKLGRAHLQRRYIAFVVRRGREPAMIGLGPMQTISNAITAFRQPMDGESGNIDAAAEAARKLRKELWLPLEQHLDGIETVIISPDTATGTLPFAALPGRREGTYLLEDYGLASVPFVHLLSRFLEKQQTKPEQRRLLVIGDVDYDAANHSQSELNAPTLLTVAEEQGRFSRSRGDVVEQWETLSGFRAELKAVTSQHQQRFGNDSDIRTLMGIGATEDVFFEEAPNFETLHVITHGFFSDPSVKSIDQLQLQQKGSAYSSAARDPFLNSWMPSLLSGLVMAGANNPPDDPEDLNDGILRASEIEAASLQNVDLVVLSACETGLGPVAGGEGLTGLQRAFQVAGARTVIASLWKVDDQATLALMTEFYRNLWEKKLTKLDALREAQLTMLRHYDRETGKVRGLSSKSVKVDTSQTAASTRLAPAYWAAFQLSGDWR